MDIIKKCFYFLLSLQIIFGIMQFLRPELSSTRAETVVSWLIHAQIIAVFALAFAALYREFHQGTSRLDSSLFWLAIALCSVSLTVFQLPNVSQFNLTQTCVFTGLMLSGLAIIGSFVYAKLEAAQQHSEQCLMWLFLWAVAIISLVLKQTPATVFSFNMSYLLGLTCLLSCMTNIVCTSQWIADYAEQPKAL